MTDIYKARARAIVMGMAPVDKFIGRKDLKSGSVQVAYSLNRLILAPLLPWYLMLASRFGIARKLVERWKDNRMADILVTVTNRGVGFVSYLTKNRYGGYILEMMTGRSMPIRPGGSVTISLDNQGTRSVGVYISLVGQAIEDYDVSNASPEGKN